MGAPKWNIKELLKITAEYLETKGIENPRLTSEILLAHLLHINRIDLYLSYDQPLTETEISGYRELIRRRIGREPIQYITGNREFWSLDFKVNPKVLIPRIESELLVELVLKKVAAVSHSNTQPRCILDLGTGSGPLAVSLAKTLPEGKIWASDISKAAVDVARFNAERHGVSDRMTFIVADLWSAFKPRKSVFDVIVSNPPYIATDMYDALQPEVRDFEPRRALDGRKDGMYFVKEIFRGAVGFLKPGGWVIIEMAPEQTKDTLEFLAQIDLYGEMERVRDYSKNYRAVMAQKPE